MRTNLLRWILGGIAGTIIIAVTSPLFVRSYLPRPLDSVRNVTTMEPGRTFRWRKEGWANTHIGPHGMPGRRDLPAPDPGTVRIAIWGDSQAEGVCVSDHQKLHAQIEQVGASLVALPLGRSGDDAADWLAQIAKVEEAFSINTHVLLVAELSDLTAALGRAPEAETGSRMESFNARIVRQVPMLVIHTARMLLTTDGYTPRRLRFSIGPAEQPVSSSAVKNASSTKFDWKQVVDRIRATTKQQVMIVYSPVLPNITDGKVVTEDSDSEEFDQLRQVADSSDVTVLDMRERFRRSAEAGRWPHGFHNGLIGSGHANSIGYEIIADAVASAVRKTTTNRE